MKSRSRSLVLIAVVLAILIGASPAMAKERVVQLLLPNCEWPFTRDRVSWTLTNVVKTQKVEVNEFTHMAIVTYDDEVTSLEQIIDALTKAGFPLEGPPKMLKWFEKPTGAEATGRAFAPFFSDKAPLHLSFCASRTKDFGGEIPMEGSTREKFIHALMQYQEKFGQEKASAIQEKFWQSREQILADSASEIEWFPSWKKGQILESLLAKTYLDLIAQMEREGLSWNLSSCRHR
jgi:copper chaperone CopZ